MKYFFIFLTLFILEEKALAQKNLNLTLHIFLSSKCPCTSRVLEQIEQVLLDAKSRRDLKIFLYDVGTKDLDRTQKFSKILRPNTEVINDGNMQIAKQLGAEVTPEVIIKDPQGNVVYQGAIAEENPVGKTKPQNYLAQTLTLLEKGQPILAHRSWGCYISSPANSIDN